MNVASLVHGSRRFQVWQRIRVAAGLNIRPAERRARPENDGVRFHSGFEDWNGLFQLLMFDEGIAVHQQQARVVGAGTHQPVQHRQRLVKVACAQQCLCKRCLDDRIPRSEGQRLANFPDRIRVCPRDCAISALIRCNSTEGGSVSRCASASIANRLAARMAQ
jgi:hypothetical protein